LAELQAELRIIDMLFARWWWNSLRRSVLSFLGPLHVVICINGYTRGTLEMMLFECFPLGSVSQVSASTKDLEPVEN
jgi:hypothetical protein